MHNSVFFQLLQVRAAGQREKVRAHMSLKRKHAQHMLNVCVCAHKCVWILTGQRVLLLLPDADRTRDKCETERERESWLMKRTGPGIEQFVSNLITSQSTSMFIQSEIKLSELQRRTRGRGNGFCLHVKLLCLALTFPTSFLHAFWMSRKKLFFFKQIVMTDQTEQIKYLQ